MPRSIARRVEQISDSAHLGTEFAMETGLSDHCQPKFRILDEAQIQRIHQAVLKILDEVGVQVNHPEALDLLAGHGARVMDDNLVQIPSSLIEDAISSAPSNLVIFNRNKTP